MTSAVHDRFVRTQNEEAKKALERRLEHAREATRREAALSEAELAAQAALDADILAVSLEKKP